MHRFLALTIVAGVLLGSGTSSLAGEANSGNGSFFRVDPGAVSIVGGTSAQWARLDLATERFSDAGLELPPLRVFFHGDPERCDGHRGLFRPQFSIVQVHICSDEVDTVYEHELAHAWASANLDSETRARFMDMAGYDTWNDAASPWNERGVEGVAVTIQQGISGTPLPPVLSEGMLLRVSAYELLTGRQSPRHARWLAGSSSSAETMTGPGLASQWAHR